MLLNIIIILFEELFCFRFVFFICVCSVTTNHIKFYCVKTSVCIEIPLKVIWSTGIYFWNVLLVFWQLSFHLWLIGFYDWGQCGVTWQYNLKTNPQIWLVACSNKSQPLFFTDLLQIVLLSVVFSSFRNSFHFLLKMVQIKVWTRIPQKS